MPKKLSMLCPSRWRPEMTARLAESIRETTDGSEVTLLVYVDSDDKTRGEYKALLQPYPFVSVVVGQPQSVSLSWNVLANLCSGDLLMMGNDDLVCVTPGWADIVHEEVARFADGIFCAWVNDDFKKADHCAFPIVSRRWYECLGYFTPRYFEFGYNDTWIYHIAQSLDRLCYIDQAVVAHRHFTHPTDPSPRDRTTEHARRGGIARRDGELFELLKPVRDRDANLLRVIMEVSK